MLCCFIFVCECFHANLPLQERQTQKADVINKLILWVCCDYELVSDERQLRVALTFNEFFMAANTCAIKCLNPSKAMEVCQTWLLMNFC